MLNWLYRRSADRQLLVATLGVLTQQLGGSAVITMEALVEMRDRVDVERNHDPEGVRITVYGAERPA